MEVAPSVSDQSNEEKKLHQQLTLCGDIQSCAKVTFPECVVTSGGREELVGGTVV